MDDGIAALAGRMTDLLAAMDGDSDPARFFLGTYLRTTEAVGAALDGGRFEDARWVSAWVVDFADRYLHALRGFRVRDFLHGQDLRPAVHLHPDRSHRHLLDRRCTFSSRRALHPGRRHRAGARLPQVD